VRTLIIHNVKSGFGSDALFEFQRSLLGEGDTCVIRTLGGGQEAPQIIEDAKQFDLVVLSGGDGTVAGLLYALRYRGVPTCVFPSGTANLFFNNLGNAAEPLAIARACRAGRCAKTDLGEMRWHTTEGAPHTAGFSIMAGFGFDAQIMLDAVPAKQTLGEAAYFVAALSNPQPNIATFDIDVDGTHYQRQGISCLLANNAMIQAEIEVVPDCTMDDGMLNVVVLEVTQTAELIVPIVAGLLDKSGKTYGRPTIESFKGRHITVTSSEPLPLQIDGDAMDGLVTSYEADILAGANSLIVDKTSRYWHARG